jgi:hypothetical protein
MRCGREKAAKADRGPASRGLLFLAIELKFWSFQEEAWKVLSARWLRSATGLGRPSDI